MSRLILKTTLLSCTFACLLACVPATAMGQYGQHPNGACGGPCDQPGCQGRCQYCVDGQCIPKRETFGYYQTQWRRWPVAPPAVAAPLPPSGDGLQFDLPSSTDEDSQIPELRHRRERAGNLPGVEPPTPDDGMNPFMDEGNMPEPAAADPDMGATLSRPTQSRLSRRGPVSNPLRSMSLPSPVARVGYNQPIQQSVPRRLPPRTPNPLRR